MVKLTKKEWVSKFTTKKFYIIGSRTFDASNLSILKLDRHYLKDCYRLTSVATQDDDHCRFPDWSFFLSCPILPSDLGTISFSSGVNFIKLFSSSLMMRPNKLECLYLAISFQSSLTFAGSTRSIPKKEASKRVGSALALKF